MKISSDDMSLAWDADRLYPGGAYFHRSRSASAIETLRDFQYSSTADLDYRHLLLTQRAKKALGNAGLLYPLNRNPPQAAAEDANGLNGVTKSGLEYESERSPRQFSQELSDIKVVKPYNGLDFFYENGKRRKFSPPGASASNHESMATQQQLEDAVPSCSVKPTGKYEPNFLWTGIITTSLKLPAVDLDPLNLIDSNLSDPILQDLAETLHHYIPAGVEDKFVEDKSSKVELSSTIQYNAPTVEDETFGCASEPLTIKCQALAEWKWLDSDKTSTADDFSQTARSLLPNAEQHSSLPNPKAHSQAQLFRSVVKPKYPIRMSQAGPQAFSWEAQKTFLQWKPRPTHGGHPTWRINPSIEAVRSTAQTVLNHLGFNGDDCIVEYMTTGGFNTIYTVKANDKDTLECKEFVLRIPLPADPYFKTECEVATIELVRHFTSMPVPLVYAYDSSSNNELGLEWILMEKAKGNPLCYTWDDLDNENHTRITRQIADWQNELSKITANLIGGLYLRWTSTHLEFFIGRLVDGGFALYRRLCYDIDRGPYYSVHAFYNAVLDMLLQEFQDPVLQALRTAEQLESGEITADSSTEAAEALVWLQMHQDDIENWRDYGPHFHVWKYPDMRAPQALKDSLLVLCPPTTDDDLQTMLQHDDISTMNILVDDVGLPTALLDWEHVGFRPLRLHPSYPRMLEGYRGVDMYDDPLDSAWRFQDPPSDLDWKNLYDNIEDIVATNLRGVYRRELERLLSPMADIFEIEDKFESDLRNYVHSPFKGPELLRWIEWVQEPDEEKDTTHADEAIDEGKIE
ncbi:hypothetical protein MMC26_000932 [Xylographa opegraphella]|nr:hypothetical protein [Xylographa opegraphella]